MGECIMGRSLWIEKSSNRTWVGLHTKQQEKLKTLLEDIANLPQPTQHSKVAILEGTKETVYRLRLGEYRVVFTTEKGELRVHRVGKRNKVYDRIDETYEAIT